MILGTYYSCFPIRLLLIKRMEGKIKYQENLIIAMSKFIQLVKVKLHFGPFDANFYRHRIRHMSGRFLLLFKRLSK